MRQVLLYTALCLEVLVLIVSLLTFSKYKNSILKYFPIYLAVVAILEIYCVFFYKTENVWLYNLFLIGEFNFLAFIFWNYFNRLNRKLLLAFVVVYNAVTIANYVFHVQNFLIEPLSQSYVLSSFFLIVMIILLFNQILRSDIRLEEILGNILFWISLGLLIYCGIALPLQAITSWENTLGEFKSGMIYIWISIVFFKNILFIFGFIWGKKIYTY